MKKGDFVKCVVSHDEGFTVGNEYQIAAGPGDDCIVFDGDIVGEHAMIIFSDTGNACYCLQSECEFGVWELVE